MQKILINAALSLLARLDFAAILEAVYASAARRISPSVLARIERLVRAVDEMERPGEEKFRHVWADLTDPGSALDAHASAVPGHLLRWAIETAVARLRA
jgi:hypothetical protein